MENRQFDQLARGLAAGASRRRVLGGLTGALLGGVALSKGSAAKSSKVTFCHKPNTVDQETISVAKSASKAHLGHGDVTGACTCNPGADACGATAGRECGTDTSGTACFCGTTTADRGGCFLGDLNNCSRTACNDNADCQSGEACVVAPCCTNGAAGVCIPFCQGGTA